MTELRSLLQSGMVIPAHPLALNRHRQLDERRQRALTRYYLAAGAGGIAVGVHTTQFAIHDPKVGLYSPVLQLGVEECTRFAAATGHIPVRVAGLVGPTRQAVAEAGTACSLGYHCGLLSLAGHASAAEAELLDHVRAVAEVIPVFGFYLQPAVGGRLLDYSFWRRFAEIENIVAIKIAPFNRYGTLDVIRAVVNSGRVGEIALYTGNDDSIIADLVTPFTFPVGSGTVTARICGGLLGQWAVWTRRAAETLERIRLLDREDPPDLRPLLELGVQLTDANAAVFDVAHAFRGCIAGIHEVLRRQGLLEGTWCLDPDEELSPGQAEELDRVCAGYPHLTDDEFVERHLDEWLGA